jgi:hypothetical protein
VAISIYEAALELEVSTARIARVRPFVQSTKISHAVLNQLICVSLARRRKCRKIVPKFRFNFGAALNISNGLNSVVIHHSVNDVVHRKIPKRKTEQQFRIAPFSFLKCQEIYFAELIRRTVELPQAK